MQDFSEAYETVRAFVLPLVESARFITGKVASGASAFIVLNREGWIVTAAHAFRKALLMPEYARQIQDYNERRERVEANLTITDEERQRQLGRLPFSQDWILNHSLWFGQDGAVATNIHFDERADLAIAKLKNFDSGRIKIFPKFADPEAYPPIAGSLCRVGYAFTEPETTLDEATGTFSMPGFQWPPLFPSVGIHTRRQALAFPDATYSFIESSDTCLPGMCGGPQFSVDGRVWGISNRSVDANSLLGLHSRDQLFISPLDPKLKTQYGNYTTRLGWAIHVKHVITLLEKHGVSYERATT